MIRKLFTKGRLRLHILRILFISVVATAILSTVITVVINSLINNSDQTMIKQAFDDLDNFVRMLDEEIPDEIDDINEINQWSGWQKIDDRWIIEVYNSDDKLVYARGTRNIRFRSAASMVRVLDKLDGAYIVVMVRVLSQESIIQAVIMLFSFAIFVALFTIQFRKFEKYTYEIADGISILAGGEMNYRIPIRGKNELSMLATHINELASALAKQMQEKRKSDTARDDLITNLAHDIRTPITVLEGYLSMLLSEDNLTEAQRREYTQISLKKCMELSDRANSIFEFVRLNSEEEQLTTKPTNAKAYITQRFEEMAMVLSNEAFQCEANVNVADSQQLNIDSAKVQRVFDNLLSNIIKYAEKSQSIVFKANVRATHIVISIKNKFVEPLDMEPERLFERMVSGDKSRQGKSAGLGLSICKIIMNMHGGDIKAAISGDSIEFLLYFLKNE